MTHLNGIRTHSSSRAALSGLAGGLAGGLISSALLSKSGRNTARSLLKVGGIAAAGRLAGKAYDAYRHNQALRPVAPLDPPGGQQWQQVAAERFQALAEVPEQQEEGVLVLQAMIAAATANGQLDAREQIRIFEQVDRSGLSAEERVSLFDELRNPQGLASLVGRVRDPETAVQVYAASLLAVDETRQESRAYLARLASRLQLPGDLVHELHAAAQPTQPKQAA